MENEKIGVIKLDSLGLIITIILIAVLVFVFWLGIRFGTNEEKIAALEDVVFNSGIYAKLKKEVAYDVQGRT